MLRLKETLRALLESRSRPLVVMGLTFAVALVCLLPAADEYLALRERSQEIGVEMEEARHRIQDLPRLTATAAEIEGELVELQNRAVSEAELHDLRGWLAELARATGCHMRKSEPQSVLVRAWHAQDNPFESPDIDPENPATNFDLTTQTVRLTLSGSLLEVQEFLKQLEAQQHLLHTRRLRLRPESESANEIVLELEILLFHLGQRVAEPTA